MTNRTDQDLDAVWARHHAEWREPAQIASQWEEARATDPDLLRSKVTGAWWEVLAQKGLTLLVTREYEHLVMALGVAGGRPSITFMRMPHPSGLAVDRERGVVHIASTRNPNQVFDLEPVTGQLSRLDVKGAPASGRPLVPVRSRYYPGSLYMHDLALVGGELHANAVGQNAVVKFDDGQAVPVWWPRSIETEKGPMFGRNHLQLNSIAAGPDLAGSYFTASTDVMSARRPGHRNFPVDRRGVVYSGATREPMVSGLTRPHSARLHEGKVWVDDSGYGELVVAAPSGITTVARLPGWTRGLCLHDGVAFVGTSRVIPRFRQYAPGLKVESSLCGLHAVDIQTGEVLGSLQWPAGNQIFAIDWVLNSMTGGFPFSIRRSKNVATREKELFYAFKTNHSQTQNR